MKQMSLLLSLALFCATDVRSHTEDPPAEPQPSTSLKSPTRATQTSPDQRGILKKSGFEEIKNADVFYTDRVLVKFDGEKFSLYSDLSHFSRNSNWPERYIEPETIVGIEKTSPLPGHKVVFGKKSDPSTWQEMYTTGGESASPEGMSESGKKAWKARIALLPLADQLKDAGFSEKPRGSGFYQNGNMAAVMKDGKIKEVMELAPHEFQGGEQGATISGYSEVNAKVNGDPIKAGALTMEKEGLSTKVYGLSGLGIYSSETFDIFIDK